MTRSAIVAITTVSSPARWSGRITVWWMPTPPRNEMPSVKTNAGQNDQPWFAISAHAMYVENIPISPCAKLMTWVAR